MPTLLQVSSGLWLNVSQVTMLQQIGEFMHVWFSDPEHPRLLTREESQVLAAYLAVRQTTLTLAEDELRLLQRRLEDLAGHGQRREDAREAE
jgi:hypothetical protein